MRKIQPIGLSRYLITEDNQAFIINPDGLKELCTRVGSNGYVSFTATYDNGQRCPVEFHRIIGLSVIPLPPDVDSSTMEINHKNGVKTDNRICNLEWVTRRENEQHSYITGLRENCTRGILLRPVDGHEFELYRSESLSACARAFECAVSTLATHMREHPDRPFMGYYVLYEKDRVKPDHIGRWKKSRTKVKI